MTIGVFTRTLGSGGTERVITKLSMLWSGVGHLVCFFTQRETDKGNYEFTCASHECAHGLWTFEDAKRILSEYPLDVVLFNGVWNAESVPSLAGYFQKNGVKTGAILHHAFNNWAFSGCNAGDFEKKELLKALDFVVCVDKMQALWWSRQHPCVFHIENPISIAPKDVGIPRAVVPNSIVWLGRAIDWGKRVTLAVEVFRRVRMKIPSATMTIVGDAPESERVKMEGLRYVGHVADISEYVRSASVHLVSTLWEVTVPQVILEARAFGVRTVAFDIPVLRDTEGVLLGEDVNEVVQLVIAELMHPNTLTPAKFVDIRNAEVQSQWERLFLSLRGEGHRLHLLCAEKKPEYMNLATFSRLVDEIQRSERYFVQAQLPALQRWQGLKNRVKRLKGLFGL